MTQNVTALLDKKIRKLQIARELLADPEMVDLLRSLLALPAAPPAAPAAASDPITKPKRKYRRRGGSLLDRTYASLREYGERTTASELAEFMKSAGYNFKAKDENIAVSKALRLLAGTGKIASERGDRPKDPIVYWIRDIVNVGDDKIPVQGELTH